MPDNAYRYRPFVDAGLNAVEVGRCQRDLVPIRQKTKTKENKDTLELRKTKGKGSHSIRQTRERKGAKIAAWRRHW